jgi:hypothetical protein
MAGAIVVAADRYSLSFIMPFLVSMFIPNRSTQISNAIMATSINPKNRPVLKASSISPHPESENMRKKQTIGKVKVFIG